MTALYLDRLTWSDIKEEIQNGRDLVVVPFGSGGYGERQGFELKFFSHRDECQF